MGELPQHTLGIGPLSGAVSGVIAPKALPQGTTGCQSLAENPTAHPEIGDRIEELGGRHTETRAPDRPIDLHQSQVNIARDGQDGLEHLHRVWVCGGIARMSPPGVDPQGIGMAAAFHTDHRPHQRRGNALGAARPVQQGRLNRADAEPDRSAPVPAVHSRQR